jgi:hypothetical protein
MHEENCLRDRKPTIRIKDDPLLKNKLDELPGGFKIEIAATQKDLEDAFSLVYREYQRMGYIRSDNGTGIHVDIRHLLDSTSVFLLRSTSIIGTVSLICDSRMFGLPMDVLYEEELEPLRREKRRIVELASLATAPQARRTSLFMYVFRAVYRHALTNDANDFCIMVNPRHVKFYKKVLLFEQMGPEKYYPKVGAPAVALRLNLDAQEERLWERYGGLDHECDLHAFFHTYVPEHEMDRWNCRHQKSSILKTDLVRFLIEKTNVLRDTTAIQRDYIRFLYPALA